MTRFFLPALVAVSLALVACARTTLPIASQADADHAAVSWPGTTTADLERGRSKYLENCSGCHQPVPPARLAPAEWKKQLGVMKERAHLAPEDEALIERYLVTMSRTRG